MTLRRINPRDKYGFAGENRGHVMYYIVARDSAEGGLLGALVPLLLSGEEIVWIHLDDYEALAERGQVPAIRTSPCLGAFSGLFGGFLDHVYKVERIPLLVQYCRTHDIDPRLRLDD